jgi:hypothetical protein
MQKMFTEDMDIAEDGGEHFPDGASGDHYGVPIADYELFYRDENESKQSASAGNGTQNPASSKPHALNRSTAYPVGPRNAESNMNQRKLSIPGRQSIFTENAAATATVQNNFQQEAQTQMYGFPAYNPADNRRGAAIPCPPVNRHQPVYDQQFFGSLGHINITHNPQDPYPSPIQHAQAAAAAFMYGQSCPPFPAQTRVVRPNQLGRPSHVMNGQSSIGVNRATSRSPAATVSHLNAGLNESIFQFRASNPVTPEQLEDRQKKRKESHNAVERRRRDHINEMIQRLGSLVAPSSTSEERNRMNKGEVLEKSVKLIETLSRVVEAQKNRLLEIDPTFSIEDEDDDDEGRKLAEQDEDSS